MKKLRRILIIDDDEVTCYLNSMLLEEMHIAEEIAYVNDGEQALAYIQKHCSGEAVEKECADLIFLDINMPKMDGFEVLEALDMLQDVDISRLHIVILTTSVNIKDVQRAGTFGDRLQGYITKPLKEEAVKQILGLIISRSTEQKGKEDQ